MEQSIRQLIESHQTNAVNIAWQGGEPTLMGFDFFRRAMTITDRYRRPGMTFLDTMQNNGIVLDDEWAAFIKEHDFLFVEGSQGLAIYVPGSKNSFPMSVFP